VLIVAGQDLLLEQWQSEFDEHLNIPRDRTKNAVDGVVTLEWGHIEFKTAQELLATENLAAYDLVILDEAHQYTKGSRSGRGWGAVFEDLVDSADAVLAMSGSVDEGWIGDAAVQNALTQNLHKCMEFSVPEAREAGVIANFEWEVRYVSAEAGETLDKLVTRTAQLAEGYDEATKTFETSLIDPTLAESDQHSFSSVSDIRSFSQSKEGSNLRDKSQTFDSFATAAFSRRPQRWQLAPSPETIATIVGEHAPARKVVVLVQSYKQARQVGAELQRQIGTDLVLVPDSDSDEQFSEISQFNEGDYSVIVGPGDVLGTGVDMPDADVAVNVGKGGVNASLIQRIGRILRNPSGDKTANFYHLVTVPQSMDALLVHEDGQRYMIRASEFRALGNRLRELPNFATMDAATDQIVGRLERAGCGAITEATDDLATIIDDDVAQQHLEQLLAEVGAADDTTAVLPRLWNSETLARDATPVKDAVEGSMDDSDTPEGTTETEPSEPLTQHLTQDRGRDEASNANPSTADDSDDRDSNGEVSEPEVTEADTDSSVSSVGQPGVTPDSSSSTIGSMPGTNYKSQTVADHEPDTGETVGTSSGGETDNAGKLTEPTARPTADSASAEANETESPNSESTSTIGRVVETVRRIFR